MEMQFILSLYKPRNQRCRRTGEDLHFHIVSGLVSLCREDAYLIVAGPSEKFVRAAFGDTFHQDLEHLSDIFPVAFP